MIKSSRYTHMAKVPVIALLLLAAAALCAAQQAAPAGTGSSSHLPSDVHHKQLVPVDHIDILLFIVIFLALFTASGAGVGGGILLVPALLLIGNFSTIAAVALSNVAIFASAIANMAFNAPRHSPYRPGPLIDWDLVVLLGPPTVAGSIAGSYIAMTIPSWIVKVLLFLSILPMASRMVLKAQVMWRRESAAASVAASVAAATAIQGDQVTKKHTAATDGGAFSTAAAALDGPCNGAVPQPAASAASAAAPPPPGQADVEEAAAAAELATAATAAAAAAEPSRSSIRPPPSRLRQPVAGTGAGAGVWSAGHPSGSGTTRLSRMSAALNARLYSWHDGSLSEAFGAELQWLDDDENRISRSSSRSPSKLVAQRGGGVGSSVIMLTPQLPPCDNTTPAAPDLEAGHDCRVSVVAALDPASKRSTVYSSIAGVCWGALEHMGCACVLGRIWPGDVTPAVAHGGGGGAAATAAAVPQPGSGPSDDGMAARVQAALLAEQYAQLPPLQVGFVLLMLAAVAASNVGANMGLPCGTPGWWAAVLSPLPLMLIILALARYYVLWKAAWRSALGLSQDDPCDLRWDARRTIVYPALCIIAGLMAGMLGLGGGVVLTPLMLELGVQPSVSVATTQVALLISSTTSAIVYTVAGTVQKDYAAVLIGIALVATVTGQAIITWIVRRTGRSSAIIIVLAVMFVASACAAAAVVVKTSLMLAADPSQLAARRQVCLSSQH